MKIKHVENIFIKLAPWLIACAAVLLIFTIGQLSKTSNAVEETSAYTRTSNCILGKSAKLPVLQEDIEECYEQVERDSGISLERFDNKK